jgi:hypothetical protein
VGDRTIRTEVKKVAEAQVEFDTATGQGHTAVLMKEAPGQVFSVDIGNLEAMSECVVEFAYVRLLDKMGGALEYVHSATWVPPYIGARDLAEAEQVGGLVGRLVDRLAGGLVGGATTAHARRKRRRRPPLTPCPHPWPRCAAPQVAAATPAFAAKVAYSLTYDISVASSAPIRSVESADGRGAISREGAGAWRVVLAEEQSDPSRDLTLLVELGGEGLPAGQVGEGGGRVPGICSAWGCGLCARQLPGSYQGACLVQAGSSSATHPAHPSPPPSPSPQAMLQTVQRAGRTKTVALATFVPRLAAPAAAPLPREVWFVVDGSGSMGGEPERQARDAALLFIKDLPHGAGACASGVGQLRSGPWSPLPTA